MSLNKGSLLLSHLIALTTFSALIMNDYFHDGWATVGLGFIVFSFLLTLSGKKLKWMPRLWDLFSILFCLFFLVELFWLSRDLLGAAMHFLTYLMIYRLLHLQSSKDELQLYLISFLQLLAAAGGGSSFSYAVSFLLSSFFMIGGLLVQHFKREQESLALSHRSLKEAIPPSIFILTPFLTMAVLAVTLLLFFLTPRIGIAFFQKKGPAPQRISGFSEKVDFGSLAPIKLDPSSVMRVVPLTGEKEAAPPYLRGMSFDAYDGLAWQNTLRRKSVVGKGSGETFTLAASPSNRPIFRKTILLEPIESSVLFTAGKALSIRGPLPNLLRDPSGTLYFPSNPLRRIEYEITSASEPLSESDRKATQIDYPASIRNHYLPSEPRPSAKITALAEEIIAPYSTLYEKIAAIENYLKSNYTYTLDVAPSSRPPLEEFLFYQKKGYCEHYASAMVLLLRSIGIASRLVTGFLPGEWNEIGKYYLIRQSDAHAWVEVYFPGERWIAFDPTTSVTQQRNPLLKLTAAYLDWMQLKWERYVVRYSLEDQFDMVQRTGEQFGNLSARVSSSLSEWKRSLLSTLARAALPLGILLFIFGLLFLLGTRRGRVGKKQDRGQREISILYAEMLRILAKKGALKKSQQTPFEFIENVRADHTEFLTEAEKITRTYCQVRFGKKHFPQEEAVQMEALLNRLRRTHK